MPRTPRRRTRERILADIARVGRENSDVTVLFHAAIADRLGLHPTDYKALGILQRVGALSAGDLARHTGLAPASVTDLLDRLESKGFVRRVRASTDRRRVLAEPVADQLTGAHELFASTRRSLARLFARYSDRDLEVITDFLHRNAERLRKETEKLHRVS